MSETVEHPAAPPSFPFVAALLCAACVGAAAWLWMRYSYRWDVTGDHLRERAAETRKGRWPDRSYVRLHGVMLAHAAVVIGGQPQVFVMPRRPGPGRNFGLAVTRLGAMLPSAADARDFNGRVYLQGVHAAWGASPPGLEQTYAVLGVDTTRSRFTGESVAGLVVGAMGVFIFTVALRHWLGRRRSVKAA